MHRYTQATAAVTQTCSATPTCSACGGRVTSYSTRPTATRSTRFRRRFGRCACPLSWLGLGVCHNILPQEQVLEYCLHAVRAELFNGPRTLLVFGTYTIGKERLFLHVARALQKQIYVNKAKMDILRCCQLDHDLAALLTTDPDATNLHALPLFMVNFGKLAAMARQMPQYEVVVGFAPTGWSYGARPGRGQGAAGQEQPQQRPATRSQRGKIILYQVRCSVFKCKHCCTCVCA